MHTMMFATTKLSDREKAFLCAFDELGGSGGHWDVAQHPSILRVTTIRKGRKVSEEVERRAETDEIEKAFRKFARLGVIERFGGCYTLSDDGREVLRDIRGDEGFRGGPAHDFGRVSRLLQAA